MGEGESNSVRIPARDVPVPSYLSPQAQALLVPRLAGNAPFPEIDDKDGWRARIRQMDEGLLPFLQMLSPGVSATVEDRTVDGVRVFDVRPENVAADDRRIILDIHGGGLFLCAGEVCRLMATGVAGRTRRHLWSVDYRMPPDHPYPAPLDDCVAAYRALLREHAPEDIIVHGASAGGNLAAALILRARDEGLPLPAGAILNTPEADLTESGDSFHTNDGVDPGLASLMPVNRLYADGADLGHPYLSPLFGDFTKGFPPTFLMTGTRDLYLSNTVRFHRALRAADIRAELHVTEAAGHGGFGGAPEGAAVDRDMRLFIASVWNDGGDDAGD